MKRLEGSQSLFVEQDDLVVDNFRGNIANDLLQIIWS